MSRAPIVDKEQLYLALSESKTSGAAFDVFCQEPANSSDKLLMLDNFVLTPHIAGWTKESLVLAVGTIVNNIKRISSGIRPLTVVNCALRVDDLMYGLLYTRHSRIN